MWSSQQWGYVSIVILFWHLEAGLVCGGASDSGSAARSALPHSRSSLASFKSHAKAASWRAVVCNHDNRPRHRGDGETVEASEILKVHVYLRLRGTYWCWMTVSYIHSEVSTLRGESLSQPFVRFHYKCANAAMPGHMQKKSWAVDLKCHWPPSGLKYRPHCSFQ